jgi:hypothetical protein
VWRYASIPPNIFPDTIFNYVKRQFYLYLLHMALQHLMIIKIPQALFYALVIFLKEWALIKQLSIKNNIPTQQEHKGGIKKQAYNKALEYCISKRPKSLC